MDRTTGVTPIVLYAHYFAHLILQCPGNRNCGPVTGWPVVPHCFKAGGPGKLGGLWLWLQVDQLSWVACSHTLEYGSLVHSMKGWTRVPNTGGPGKLGGLWLWTQVDQLSWVACNHTLEYGSLVFPMKGEPGCPPTGGPD